MKFDTIIKGDLVLPEQTLKNGVIGIQNGKITGIMEGIDRNIACKEIDAKGRLIFPGFIDSHVHSFSYPGEGFEHSTRAAAAGGVTTIVEMPYDKGNPTNTIQAYQAKINLVKKKAFVDVALLATIQKKGNLDIIEPLADLGACGFKMSLYETDPDRFPRIETDVLFKSFPIFAALNLPVGFHAEDDSLIDPIVNEYKTRGKTFPLAHCQTRPPVSETLSVLKLLELAYWTKAPLHLYHISHPRCLIFVKLFRNMGVNVSAETCPHYLAMDDTQMDRVKAFAKINPPMRPKEDVETMWQFLKEGIVDTIASDHAPWPLEMKTHDNIFANASGAPGLETLFPLIFTLGRERGLDLQCISRLLSGNPAQRFGLSHCKGRIALGLDADLVIVNPDEEWVYDPETSFSSAKWSPYKDWSLKGKVTRTLLRGHSVFENNKVTAGPETGSYVKARHRGEPPC